VVANVIILRTTLDLRPVFDYIGINIIESLHNFFIANVVLSNIQSDRAGVANKVVDLHIPGRELLPWVMNGIYKTRYEGQHHQLLRKLNIQDLDNSKNLFFEHYVFF
jgi:hypothetical protein